MTVQCLTFLWVTRQLFLFDTYTLMHEMSSGQWPTRILAEYRVCHVIYHIKISSRNLMPFFSTCIHRILNPVVNGLLTTRHVHVGKFKLINPVTNLIHCKESRHFFDMPWHLHSKLENPVDQKFLTKDFFSGSLN